MSCSEHYEQLMMLLISISLFLDVCCVMADEVEEEVAVVQDAAWVAIHRDVRFVFPTPFPPFPPSPPLPLLHSPLPLLHSTHTFFPSTGE